MECQQLDAKLIDIDVKPVYLTVAVDDDAGKLRVPVDERLDRLLDLVFDKAPHIKDFFPELFEVFPVSFVGMLKDHNVSLIRTGR
jgi:hypothetical protein